MTDYSPIPLRFQPGVVKDAGRRTNEAGWWDANNVRYVQGLPQSIGGWTRPFTTDIVGTPRSLFSWVDLDGIQLMSIGTQLKYYIEAGGSLSDITPLRSTASLSANPIATTNSSTTVTVSHTAHGANAGEYVTLSGSTDVNGVTAAMINKEHEIVTATTNSYTITVSGAASGTGSGGGASVQAEYQIAPGLDSTLVGGGYGAGTWGRGTWDSTSDVNVAGAQLRVWTQDNWGEDLLFNPRLGGIYYYDRSSPARGVLLSSMGGAAGVPSQCMQIVVASEVRHAIAFGCEPYGGSGVDNMVWRWCDQEDVVDWEPTSTNTAGGNRFLVGSTFMQAVETRNEICAFTDRALYSVQYVGTPDIFTQRIISPSTRLIGPKAAAQYMDTVYWMEARGFKFYNGQVGELPCPLKEYVFRDINLFQLWKAHCAVNSLYGEVWWFYASASSEEIDRCVLVKVPEMWWANGTLSRTAWLDNDVFTLPRAADVNGYIYDQETGHDDGSETPSIAMETHIESSPILVADGIRAMRIKSIWPDVDFLDSDASSPEVSIVLKLQDKPGTTLHGSTDSDVARTVATPIQEFTDRVDIGKRARLITFRLEGAQKGLQWRLGTPHMELRPDGRRG